ncbi:hypothetical protein [Priestia aryabhattai]|uniref:hypothetical protein n=1 Tax=Priestia aryabhattai TaxID=412384 RepID=UPI001CFC86F5|nr:hypothetical protein [Priestia aryabhattai]
MDGNTYICGIFYAEKKGEESYYLNIKGSSSSTSFQEVYWKNLMVFFSTAYRTNPKSNLLLFSNAKPPMREWEKFLSDIGVKIINISYEHKPPKGHWHAWQSTFYIIDCLNYLGNQVSEQDYVYFMDIDCVVLKNLDRLNEILKRDQFVNFAIDYPVDYKVHGVSRIDMKSSFSKNSGEINEYPTYFGGEIYGFYGKSNILKIYKEATDAWKMTVIEKSMVFNTEEHLFSFIFWKLNKQYNNAQSFIKRIWTDASNHRNVECSDTKLTIWHLPAEKRKGLYNLTEKVLNDKSKFWTVDSEDYITYLGKFVSIPRRSISRVFTESSKKIAKKLKIRTN